MKRELESRPRLEDLEELQNSLDELESIYQQQLNEKDAIITKLQVERDHLSHELYSTPVVHQSTADDSPQELPIYKAAQPTDPSQGKMIGAGYVKEMVIAVLIVHMKMIYFRMP